MAQTAQHFEAQITQMVKLDYLLYLLHSGGERGSDLSLVKGNGWSRYQRADLQHPRIVRVVFEPQTRVTLVGENKRRISNDIRL